MCYQRSRLEAELEESSLVEEAVEKIMAVNLMSSAVAVAATVVAE